MAENLNIKIRAFDTTKKAFGSVTLGLKRITGSIFSMRTALIGVAGVAGFGLLIKSSLTSIDTLAKTASKIGTTTEALGKLRYAAEISGVSITTVDMAMQRFTRRLAEAAKGTGEAKGALKELNIDARALMKLPLDEQVLALSEAFSKQKNSADKVRLAMKLFDSEGVALVNTLGLGSEALKEMFGEAEALGFILSSEAAKGVEDTNDSITTLSRVIGGIKDQFTAALAPAIKLAVGWLQELILEAKGADGTFKTFGKSLAVSFLNGTKAAILGLDKILEATASFFEEANSYFDSWNSKAAQAQVDHLQRKMEGLSASVAEMESGNLGFLNQITSMLSGGSKADILPNERAALLEVQEKLVKAKDALLSYQKTDDPSKPSFLRDLIDSNWAVSMDELIAAIEKVDSATSGLIDKEKIEGLSVYQRAVGAMTQTFEDFKNVLPNVEEGMTSLTNNAMGAFTKGFTDAITGAAKFSDAMKAMAKSVVDSLIQMLVQYYITQAVFGAITGFIGGGGGGGGGVGTAGTTMGGSGQRAIGGSVQSGGSYLVGERGPEIFSPNASGSIIPNNRLGGGGGVTVNQTINVTTGIQSTVRAEIVSLMPQIAQAAKGAVADARLRGGNFSKAMAGA